MKPRYTILAVDDTQVNIIILRDMLKNDYDVETASNGQEAVEKARQILPDLILMDVMMPVMDGFSACRELKSDSITANIPIIFLTARTNAEDIVEGLEAGAVDYVCKPFSRIELQMRIKNHIALVQSQKKIEAEYREKLLTQSLLDEKTQQLSLITNNITDAVIMCGSDGKIVFASPSCKKLFGLDQDFFIGKYFWETSGNNGENYKIKKFFSDLAIERKKTSRFVLADSEIGGISAIECRGTTIISASRQIEGFVIDITNITPLASAMILQNRLRRITMKINEISSFSQSLIFGVGCLCKITPADEVILLIGRSDGKTQYFCCKKSENKIFKGLLNDGQNIEFANFLKIRPQETLSGENSPEIPHCISNRNKNYAVNPIIVGKTIVGLVYVGGSRKFSTEDTYSVGIISNLLRNAIYRRVFQQRLRQKEQQLRNIFDYSANAIITLDKNLRPVRYNNRFLEMFLLENSMVEGHKITDILPKETSENLLQLIGKVEAGSPFETEEMSVVKSLDNKFYVEATVSYINAKNDSLVWLLIFTDITKLKNIDRTIFSTITATEEKERTRMARELHDGLGALLSSINIYINLILSHSVEDEEIFNTLELTKSLVAEAIQNTKEIANNLHPVILTRFGLVATIKSFIESLQKTQLINIDFDYQNFKTIENKDFELTLYRIIHELINNTLKYAEAQNITIILETRLSSINLFYADNGKGFDLEKLPENKNGSGMGLSNIFGRVKSLNGNCIFKTKPQEGLQVSVEIPYIA